MRWKLIYFSSFTSYQVSNMDEKGKKSEAKYFFLLYFFFGRKDTRRQKYFPTAGTRQTYIFWLTGTANRGFAEKAITAPRRLNRRGRVGVVRLKGICVRVIDGVVHLWATRRKQVLCEMAEGIRRWQQRVDFGFEGID